MSAFAIGLDHLLSWRHLRTVARLQPTFAHLTLIRGAMEGMVMAKWLLDPDISARVRCARAAAAQLDDYRQRRAYEGRLRIPPRLSRPARSAAQRMTALERLMRRQGVERIAMPKITELFAMYAAPSDTGHGETVYRVISAVAHSKVWSLGGVVEFGEVVDPPAGPRVARMATRGAATYEATTLAIELAVSALGDLERYATPASQ